MYKNYLTIVFLWTLHILSLHTKDIPMKTISFVTGNVSKFNALQQMFRQLDIPVTLIMQDLDIDEIQSLDIQKVAKAKAAAAYALVQGPVLIDDSGIYLQKYKNFPGTLSKHVGKSIGMDGLWLLAQSDPRAYCICCLVYQDAPDRQFVFTGVCEGRVIAPRASLINKDFLFSDIFIPMDQTENKTFTELIAQGYHEGHRLEAAKQFKEFIHT